MSKERLEEIRGCVKHDYVHNHGMMISVSPRDVEWLIERAESLQEQLDAKIMLVNRGDEEYRYAQQERMIELEQQNKRYREALEFYADKDNYKLEHFDPNLDDYMSTVDYDEGQKARQTIGSEKIND